MILRKYVPSKLIFQHKKNTHHFGFPLKRNLNKTKGKILDKKFV